MNNIKMLYFDRTMFLKELLLIKQVHQRSVVFVTIGISYIIVLSLSKMSAIDVIIY